MPRRKLTTVEEIRDIMADDPLPAPSTSRQLRPRALSRSSRGTSRSTSSSRSASIASALSTRAARQYSSPPIAVLNPNGNGPTTDERGPMPVAGPSQIYPGMISALAPPSGPHGGGTSESMEIGSVIAGKRKRRSGNPVVNHDPQHGEESNESRSRIARKRRRVNNPAAQDGGVPSMSASTSTRREREIHDRAWHSFDFSSPSLPDDRPSDIDVDLTSMAAEYGSVSAHSSGTSTRDDQDSFGHSLSFPTPEIQELRDLPPRYHAPAPAPTVYEIIDEDESESGAIPSAGVHTAGTNDTSNVSSNSLARLLHATNVDPRPRFSLSPSPPLASSSKTRLKAKAKAQPAAAESSASVPLVRSDRGNVSESTVEPLSSYNCPICFCPPTYATLTPCGHVCCGECLFTAVKTTMQRATNMMVNEPVVARCPVCRAQLIGWDGQGGGVIGLKARTVFSLS